MPLSVSEDEILNKFLASNYRNDRRRELNVRIALFVASSDGFESSITCMKDLNKLVKRYKEITGDRNQGRIHKRR